MPVSRSTERRRQPRHWRFITVGALLGFVIFGVISMIGPDRGGEFGRSVDPGAALGLLSMFGIFIGGLLGAVVAALFAGRGR